MSKLSKEAVDFRYLLLDHYKKLALSENEVAVILMIDHLLLTGNKMVTADLLRLKMSLKTDQIDKILSTLYKRGFISYDEEKGSGLRTSLEGLRNKLYQEFEAELAKESVNLHSATRSSELTRLYAYIEKRFNRTISPLESDMINAWLDENYSEQDIVDAVENAITKGKKTFKSVDKLLRTSRKSQDISKEGVTAVDEKWGKDIEESLRIAQTKWIDDD